MGKFISRLKYTSFNSFLSTIFIQTKKHIIHLHFHWKIFCPGIGLRFSFTFPFSVIELMRTIERADRWNLIFMYCFLRFFLKTVRVCASVFSMTVACTSTNPGCTSGRPISENSSPPTSSTCFNYMNFSKVSISRYQTNCTFSNFNLSPMVGGQ